MSIKITAHRGSSGIAPENTLIALQKAIDAGADYAEIDVQETADGKLVLLHDSDLKRTTGIKKNIWQTTYNELMQLEAGSWFHESYSGEKIPLLEEAIELVRGKMQLNIELKTNGHQVELAEQTCRTIIKQNFANEAVITSFELPQIQIALERAKNIRTGLIFYFMPSFDILTMPHPVLSLHKRNAGKRFIKKAHEAGKELHIWTVNEEKEMLELIGTEVDNIITNFPEKLKPLITKTSKGTGS